MRDLRARRRRHAVAPMLAASRAAPCPLTGEPPKDTEASPQLAAVALALVAAITAWRFREPDAAVAVGFLYVIPVAALAVRHGPWGGLAAATLASALTAWWGATATPMALEGHLTRVAAFFCVAAVVGWQVQARLRERREFEAQLLALVGEDELTGLPNRRGWDERAGVELSRAGRSGRCSVAMIDLDNLKVVNDTHGHAAGDRLLVACASAWSGAIRGADFLARLGGDEFALLLPGCDADAAADVVARMRLAMGDGATFSAGIACSDGGEGLAQVMARADAALYAAKRAGRGTTTTGGGEEAPAAHARHRYTVVA